MRRVVFWALGVAMGTVAIHIAVVTAIPHVVMGVLMRGIGPKSAVNRCFHPPLPTADTPRVMRPSPDVAYSTALFDVQARALHVVVPVTAPYTSLLGFANNTDNFLRVNDITAGGSTIDVVVVGPSTPRVGLEGLRLAVSPSDRGMLLVQRAVPDAASFPAIDAARQRMQCELR